MEFRGRSVGRDASGVNEPIGLGEWIKWFALTPAQGLMQGPKGQSQRPASSGWGSSEGSSKPPPHQTGGLGSAVSSPSGVRAEPQKKLVLVHLGVTKITNFNDFAFVLGMTLFSARLCSNRSGGGGSSQSMLGLAPTSHSSL